MIAAVIVILSMVAAWKWLHLGKELPTGLHISLQADVEMRKVRFFHHEDGRLRLDLTASKVRYYDSRREVDLQSVKAHLWGKEESEVRIAAAQGAYSIATGAVTLTGNVRLETPQGDVLTTQKITMDQHHMVMESHSPVVFRRAGLLLRARGFRYDFRQGRLVVDQQRSVIKGEELPQ